MRHPDQGVSVYQKLVNTGVLFLQPAQMNWGVFPVHLGVVGRVLDLLHEVRILSNDWTSGSSRSEPTAGERPRADREPTRESSLSAAVGLREGSSTCGETVEHMQTLRSASIS